MESLMISEHCAPSTSPSRALSLLFSLLAGKPRLGDRFGRTASATRKSAQARVDAVFLGSCENFLFNMRYTLRQIEYFIATADASPLCGGENVFSRRGELIGDVALARPPASGDRKREPDMARIDFQ